MFEVTINKKYKGYKDTLYRIKIEKAHKGWAASLYRDESGRLLDTCTIGNFDESQPIWMLLKLVLQRFKSGRDNLAGNSETIQTSPQ